MNTALCAILLVAVIAIMPAYGQRSPYVPLPWSYPGLLPRFGEQEGQQNAVPSTSTTTSTPPPRIQPSRPVSGGNTGNDLGNRIGDRPNRVTPQRGSNLPCTDCLLYITSSGEILRVARDQTDNKS